MLTFDEEVGKQHQLEYRTILARKLLDHTEELEVENGNEAMCQLECLFARYLSLSERMTWIPRGYSGQKNEPINCVHTDVWF